MGEALFALIFAAALVEQAALPPNACQGAMTEGEIELADEPAGPESEQLLAQGHHLLLDLGRGFVGLMMRSTREFAEAPPHSSYDFKLKRGEHIHGNANRRLAKRAAPDLDEVSRSQRWPIRPGGRRIGLDHRRQYQYHDRHPGQSGRTAPGSAKIFANPVNTHMSVVPAFFPVKLRQGDHTLQLSGLTSATTSDFNDFFTVVLLY